jgi:hypothetical protein
MDARTAEALEKSIEHWRENCAALMELVKIGPAQCALCCMFHSIFDGSRNDCEGCPIVTATETTLCRSTPYDRAEAAYAIWEDCDADDAGDDLKRQQAEAAFRAAAREELAFLESLREPVDEEDEIGETIAEEIAEAEKVALRSEPYQDDLID